MHDKVQKERFGCKRVQLYFSVICFCGAHHFPQQFRAVVRRIAERKIYVYLYKRKFGIVRDFYKRRNLAARHSALNYLHS